MSVCWEDLMQLVYENRKNLKSAFLQYLRLKNIHSFFLIFSQKVLRATVEGRKTHW